MTRVIKETDGKESARSSRPRLAPSDKAQLLPGKGLLVYHLQELAKPSSPCLNLIRHRATREAGLPLSPRRKR